MGFDYFASSCDTIKPTVIKQVVPTAWAAFNTTIVRVARSFHRTKEDVLANVGREEDHGDSQYGDDEDYNAAVSKVVIPALDRLRQAFATATGGIRLHIGWADGDTFRGSDLRDEVYWYISHHHQPTPAYQAFAATYGEAITKTWISGG